MKNLLIIAALIFSAAVPAQNNIPKLEAHGDLVKATYFYDNGQVQQSGFFKNGKLEGQWAAFDINGSKKSIGEYHNGQKVGKWIFFNKTQLSEVDYSNSRVASVRNWTQEGLANRN